jgi:serine/threonine protein kinase
MHDAEQLPSIADEQTRRARARVGQLVRGRWKLDALLGVGGMAAVYRATHRNGKRVALKMLHNELSTNTEVRQRFVDEGYAANRVGHTGAVSVIDDDVAEDGSAFLVMDLLEGETIETRLHRRGRLWPGEVLPITYALLDVLASAHDRGIVHRDIKPDNVFITREGKVKLLDFGIARMIEPGRPRTTQSGATMGTPAFMPPEQARGRWDELDGRTDLWAVGATMFIQLTGRQVREAETPNEELLLAMTKAAPSVAEFARNLPPSLVELVDRALSFDQNERWPDARAMQQAVRAVQLELGAEGSLPISSPSTIPPADSAAPVTLLTPHPMVSSSFRTAVPAWRRPRTALVVAGAAIAFGALFLSSRPSRGPHDTAKVTAASQAVEPVAPVVAEPPKADPGLEPETASGHEVVAARDAVPGVEPEHAAEPASTTGPTPAVAPTKAKPHPTKAVLRPAAAGKVMSGPASGPAETPAPIAPTHDSQLPSTVDPLDRRR